MKRLISLLMVLCICASGMHAGFAEAQDYIDYTGSGVVSRVNGNQTRALLSELNVAYMDTPDSYLTYNTPTTWTAHAIGGDGNYKYGFHLYYRTDKTSNRFFSTGTKQAASATNTFTAAPTIENAQYVVQLLLYDTSGNGLTYTSQVFEMVKPDDYKDATTVPGKVEALVAQCLREAGASDYARALWFHDWLIHNANYDYTYTYYYADGVLLHGTGVCQSYALAYDMLLKKVGIDCVYITGTASGVGHAWNMIKLDGKWYHVDCTWDDPGNGGGNEHHGYFCVTDAMLSRDHEWASKWAYMPECTSTDYNHGIRSGAYDVTGQASLESAFGDAIAKRRPYAEFIYTGGDASFNMNALINGLLQAAYGKTISGYKTKPGSIYNVVVAFDYGNGLLDLTGPTELIFDSRIYLNVGESADLDPEYSPKVYCKQTEDSFVWTSLDRDDFDIIWTSSNTGIASAADGVIAGVADGVAVITATCGDVSARCLVQVGNVIRETVNQVVIPVGATQIEPEAFLNCAAIEEVVIPEGTVTAIGSRAFAGCDALVQVYIPADVEAIAQDAFDEESMTLIICGEGTAAHLFAVENEMFFVLK